MNHFTAASCQLEYGMKVWKRLKPVLAGKTAVQVVMVIHHHAGNSGKMTNGKP
jgi:cytosine/uracil/thiamine/allantoin permease